MLSIKRQLKREVVPRRYRIQFKDFGAHPPASLAKKQCNGYYTALSQCQDCFGAGVSPFFRIEVIRNRFSVCESPRYNHII
jgi:hypothetical protein